MNRLEITNEIERLEIARLDAQRRRQWSLALHFAKKQTTLLRDLVDAHRAERIQVRLGIKTDPGFLGSEN